MLVAKSLNEGQRTATLSPAITVTPTIRFYADRSVVAPGDTVKLYGFLEIPPEIGDIAPTYYIPGTDILIGDNIVDIYDVVTVLSLYGKTPEYPYWYPPADLNKDGIVDIYDVAAVCAAYGINSDGKTIEIQKYDPKTDQWITIGSVTTYEDYDFVEQPGVGTLNSLRHGYFEYSYTVPPDIPSGSVLYFRAYFPGGEYPH